MLEASKKKIQSAEKQETSEIKEKDINYKVKTLTEKEVRRGLVKLKKGTTMDR